MRRVRVLEEENARLRHLVAHLTLVWRDDLDEKRAAIKMRRTVAAQE